MFLSYGQTFSASCLTWTWLNLSLWSWVKCRCHFVSLIFVVEIVPASPEIYVVLYLSCPLNDTTLKEQVGWHEEGDLDFWVSYYYRPFCLRWHHFGCFMGVRPYGLFQFKLSTRNAESLGFILKGIIPHLPPQNVLWGAFESWCWQSASWISTKMGYMKSIFFSNGKQKTKKLPNSS